ncbi:MAG: polysulfide reductase NrfD [Gemmatimonadetes bacterium]|jgi:Ni/Fe-hydrogenase subunit HybB-like protein|nr:polysulfide reductase NrfD [Gemmatimonadota bacterium]MBT5055307.1 polysulfide reductase NrfD [Gemmatimonadota bacterium]MBT5142823.1 polysulfide reductase NrfD [Gemmatimonadota bacterium]MBT5589416.1 polysulfide reductase NrfD [Gemmatimonadota bacterium]MBT5960043.1 polysulfide reductase NrfD [Gemmatimonadota bacterium]
MLVVVYPYLTGLVAGAFILASLERVFNVKEVQPTYRLALLTALAFLIVAPLPLLSHLGHPERALEIFLTPHLQSAMAMFGFVYAWYLAVVLLLEVWFDYRKELIVWSRSESGIRKWLHQLMTLGSTDLSDDAVRFDHTAGRVITIIGIPSAFLLHGYVGFIFGSVKANPWWSSVLIPIVFLFSAIVSGIALMMLIYMATSILRRKPVDMSCVDKLASFLFYALIIDVSLEMLDFIHRLYEAEESIHILSEMISGKLFVSLFVLQLGLGTVVPLVSLALFSPVLHKRALVPVPDELRRMMYWGVAVLIQLGIFSTRWNVVVGGQLFSKSLRGLTAYKMQLLGLEGGLMSGFLLLLPFAILAFLIWLLPPWPEREVTMEEVARARK